MEIEVSPISLDARLEYIAKISENKLVNPKKFPWATIILAAVITSGVWYAVIIYQRNKEKKIIGG